jgi:hypothetical protein
MQKYNPKQGNNLETTRDNGTSYPYFKKGEALHRPKWCWKDT